MALAHSTHAANNAGSASTVTVNFDPGSGSDRLLVVHILWEAEFPNASVEISSVTMDGTAMTATGADYRQTSGSGYECASIQYYMLDTDLPAGGSNYDMVITLDTAIQGLYGVCEVYTGADQAAPDATAGSTSDSNYTTTTNITPVVANSVITDSTSCGHNGHTYTHGTSETERYDNNTNSFSGTATDKIVSSTSTTSMTDTGSQSFVNTRIVQSVCAWAEASAGGATPKFLTLLGVG